MIDIDSNIIPSNIEQLLKQFNGNPLNIKGILKNHKYIGPTGSFSRFGSGAKIKLGENTEKPLDALLTFLKDFRTVVPQEKYKSEYEQIMDLDLI